MQYTPSSRHRQIVQQEPTRKYGASRARTHAVPGRGRQEIRGHPLRMAVISATVKEPNNFGGSALSGCARFQRAGGGAGGEQKANHGHNNLVATRSMHRPWQRPRHRELAASGSLCLQHHSSRFAVADCEWPLATT